MKKAPSPLCPFPKQAIYDPSPPRGLTNKNAMRHRTGQNRQQFSRFATPLDELIAADNMVRVVDAFVDAIDLEKPVTLPALSTGWTPKRLPSK